MKSENNIVEGALKVHKLTFWEAAMIIVGANIGSGILGLAYSARKAGWPVLMLWLIIAGFFTTASMLYVAETTLRTRKVMQLPGLAKKYVGELGAWLVFISVAANTIGCLIAYTNGSGRILSEMFGLSTQIGSLLFSVPAVIVVWFGLKATGVAEKVISFGMMALLAVIIAASFLAENSDLSNAILQTGLMRYRFSMLRSFVILLSMPFLNWQEVWHMISRSWRRLLSRECH